MNAEFSGARILVVGLGTTGFSAARVLARLGANVRVTESEVGGAVEQRAAALRSEGIEVELGGHNLEAIDAELAILSPGIPPDARIARAIGGAGIEVMSDIELAWRLARSAVLAVTGTNGKTTTTTLLAGMLNEAAIPAVPAGNIGFPASEAVFRVPPSGALVLEVSSFQLAATSTFRPRVAVVLNVAEDHTDWHGTFTAYLDAKARITRNQGPGDVLIVNTDDAGAASIAQRSRARVVGFSTARSVADGIGVDGRAIVWRDQDVLSVDDVPLVGKAGLEDVIAAAGAALEFGADPAAIARAVKSFRPLRHRLEVVAQAAGVSYIDDSKATNPHATLTAVRGMHEVVLIAGGRSKGIDLRPLRHVVPPVRAVVAIGEAASDLEEVFSGFVPVERAHSMDDAVRRARSHAIPGGSVLLSPACASLDMYESYAQRGDDFARAVRRALQGGN